MQVKCDVLDNGAVFLTDYVSTVESISIKVWIKCGSIDEKSYSSGISHCIEHMNFKGTTTYTAKQIAEEFEMMGGYLNAYTGKEQTVFYAKFLKENFDKASSILYDLVCNSVYLPEELEREKQVIIEEILEIQDDPSDLVYELFQAKQYEGQQAGKPVIGTVQSVTSITREEILRYVKEFYVPKNIVIGVSGNFDEDIVSNAVHRGFGTFCCEQNAHSVVRDCCAKPRYVNGISLLEKDTQQTHMMLGFPGVSAYSVDYYVYQIAALIAGGSMASRLFQEIRERRGLVYGITASAPTYSCFGGWEVYASSQHEKMNEVVDAVIQELRKMSEVIYDHEIERAKNQLKSGLLMALESTSSRAEKLVADYVLFKKLKKVNEMIDEIQSITTGDVKRVMQGIISTLPAVAVVGQITAFEEYDEIVRKLHS